MRSQRTALRRSMAESEHFVGIAVGIEQVLEGCAHGVVGLLVGHIPVFIVETYKQQHSEAHRLGRFIGKLRAAVVLGGGLRLCDEAREIIVLLAVLDAQMGLDLIDGNDHGQPSAPSEAGAIMPASRRAARRRLKSSRSAATVPASLSGM